MKVIPREPSMDIGGLRRDYTRAPLEELIAYVHGASHDGTRNQLHHTYRFTQRERAWLVMIQRILESLGSRGWIYREGSQRAVWALETTYSIDVPHWREIPHTIGEWNAYIRGYFDAEGGVPRNLTSRMYIQFVQKHRVELEEIRSKLIEQEIQCGIIHNPSVCIDPNYWRFFIASNAHQKFMTQIGSWHPRKSLVFVQRMKI